MDKPFTVPVILDDRTVLSPHDERDFLEPIPDVKIKEKFGKQVSLPVLDQGRTEFCTAFAIYRAFGSHLAGSGRTEFRENYKSSTAIEIGKYQTSFMTKEFWKKLLRMDIWLWKGKNMRAALWNFNHGITLPGGDMLKIKAYSRAIDRVPEDLCKYIQHKGVLFCGVLLRGLVPFDRDGRYVGSGQIFGGHAICIVGFNLKKREFYFTNSWGEEWGDNGYGIIPFSKYTDIMESWIIKEPAFYDKQS